METLKKESEEPDAVSFIVVGTEAKQLMILPQDPVNSNLLCKVTLPSVPVHLCIFGLFDIGTETDSVHSYGTKNSL